ncbi:RagB/SusD family nutrient uptake outer membrane protein [Aestuariibaculum sp. YM273]|uniref:RagB/SusD family nutrient uptake outer membrane protein n=1 Tax=Aestuariibaculum sp. YM273 TaxID=3070659 RepID=UPI0027DDBE85|nr:RagB/SusD family nutrient uptake outer membrane protein [Aestuariibaculum sp. YM273]WMI66769.1 RagB/SusD family nutrient uptake outer membrane protein [Aestuariibaculum sp. YM273]
MNKIKIYIVLIAGLLSSCNEDFLETKPMDSYSDAAVWSDPALVEAFVNSINMGRQNGFQLEMMASLSDISMTKRGEVNPILNSGIGDSYLSVLDPNHWLISYRNVTWNRLYQNIRACNVFFDNMSTSTLEGDEIDRLKGEVYFFRAYYYHWLLKFWGGVPLVDQAYELSDDLKISRSSLEETVNFIVSDLDAAANLLPVSGDKARATQGAALALKSRVLLFAASDLCNSNASWTSGFNNPELVSYTDGNQMARWQAAKDAAKAVMDLNLYSLYGGTNPGSLEQAKENYINLFLNYGSEEDILLTFHDMLNDNDWQEPNPGLFYGPNGYHCWGNHTPTQQFIDSFEMVDGSMFDWSNPTHQVAPYDNRDPRFYANILYDGSQWRQRPANVISADPEGIIQTGYYENEDGSFRGGLDTRQGIDDWNGTYTGYYIRKFVDPAIDHQFEKQDLPWRELRYAEVLLNYIEASFELGEEGEARTYLNMIRNRAGMPDVPDTESGDDLESRYRNERKIELAYEQHRYFDIRRWMIAPDVIENVQGIRIEYPYGGGDLSYQVFEVQNQTRNWENKSYFLPILLDEINRNNLLIQNPDY